MKLTRRKVGYFIGCLLLTGVGIFFGIRIIRQLQPSGKDIVFVSGWKIFIMNADGTGLTQLTRWTNAHSPDWSPDGAKIVYMAPPHPFTSSEIYVMNADGSGKTRLTHNEIFEESPAWSPDGTQIVFSSLPEDCICQEIYMMNPDGSNLIRLTANKTGTGYEANLPQDESPIWSPNGTRIAFVRGSYEDKPKLHIMNTDESNITALTHHSEGDYNFAWSPDGIKIVFTSDRDGNYEIYLVNADGSGEVRLTHNEADDNYPTWSPDGTQIAFVSSRDGNKEIYSMNIDGSSQTRLTNNEVTDNEPAWSSDGTSIGFISDGNVYSMSPNGSKQTRLTDYKSAWVLHWRP